MVASGVPGALPAVAPPGARPSPGCLTTSVSMPISVPAAVPSTRKVRPWSRPPVPAPHPGRQAQRPPRHPGRIGPAGAVPRRHSTVRPSSWTRPPRPRPTRRPPPESQEFLPWYSSVHRGAGFRSRRATAAYEEARRAVLRFAGRDPDGTDVAILCRNTTEAINHLAYRLRLHPDDVVVTTVVEHHANLLPWGRVAHPPLRRVLRAGTFTVEDVSAALDAGPAPPALLAVTGASNVTGWLPPIDAIIEAAHERGVPVVVDAAQLAPHRPLPAAADFVAFSGHKLYAPFGSGALIGPRALFETGDPFLAGGGAVDLVGLDEVIWTAPPDREEAGSPNVVGAVALHAAIDALGPIGWEAIVAHEEELARRLAAGLGRHRRRPAPRVRARPVRGRWPAVRDPAGGGLHRRGHASCAGGGPSERRVRRSPSVTAASAPIPTWSGCSASRTQRRPYYREEVLQGDHRQCPGRCGPAPGSGPRARTSSAWWPRWPSWPGAPRRPSPTGRTRPLATSSRSPTCPVGGMPAPSPAPPAARG